MVDLDFVRLRLRLSSDSSACRLRSRKTAIDLVRRQGFGHEEQAQATIVRDLEANLAAKLADRSSSFADDDLRVLLLSLFFSVLSLLALASSSRLLLPIVQSSLPNAESCPATAVKMSRS